MNFFLDCVAALSALLNTTRRLNIFLKFPILFLVKRLVIPFMRALGGNHENRIRAVMNIGVSTHINKYGILAFLTHRIVSVCQVSFNVNKLLSLFVNNHIFIRIYSQTFGRQCIYRIRT